MPPRSGKRAATLICSTQLFYFPLFLLSLFYRAQRQSAAKSTKPAERAGIVTFDIFLVVTSFVRGEPKRHSHTRVSRDTEKERGGGHKIFRIRVSTKPFVNPGRSEVTTGKMITDSASKHSPPETILPKAPIPN